MTTSPQEACVNIIDTGIGEIRWKASSLLDQQIMESLEEAIKRNGSLKVLEVIRTLE